MALPLELQLKLFFEAYVATLDRNELEDWPGYFTADGLYRVTARDNVERGLEHATLYCDGQGMLQDRVAAIRKSTVFEPRRMRHIVGAVRVTARDAGTIAAETSFVLYESIADRDTRLALVGSYRDEVSSEGERFLLRRRDCLLDSARIFNSLIYPI